MSEVSIIKHLKIRAGFNDISGVLVTTRSDREFRNLGSLLLQRKTISIRKRSEIEPAKGVAGRKGGGGDRSTAVPK